MAKSRAKNEFATTAWTQILEAQGRGAHSSRRRKCLEMLAENYWAPVHAFVMRRAQNEQDALDLTQAYFAAFLRKNFLDQAAPERGRFRAFVLASLKNFLSNQYQHERAAKRAPAGGLRSLEELKGAGGSSNLPPAEQDPVDIFFMREWARSVLARALERMQQQCAERGQLDYWTVLDCDIRAARAGTAHGYGKLATELGWPVEKVRKTLHRARQRFAECLRAQVRESVESDQDVEAELNELRKYFN